MDNAANENEEITTPTISTTQTTYKTTSKVYLRTCRQVTYYDKQSRRRITFPETPLLTHTTSVEICLCNSVPIVRFCYHGGRWLQPSGSCCDNDEIISNTTKRLNELVSYAQSNMSTAIDDVRNITQRDRLDLSTVDIHLISRILNKAYDSVNVINNTNNFFNIVSNVMGAHKEALNSSQQLLNSTDRILYSLDRMLIASNRDSIIQDELLSYSVKIFDNVCGGMVKSRNKNECGSLQMEYLDPNNYEEILTYNDFEFAFVLSPNIVTTHDHYFITVFCNEALFNDRQGNTVGSWVISILFPGVVQYPGNSPIKIYFKGFENNPHQVCNHWKYGFDNHIPINGSWRPDGNATKFKDGFYLCEVNHTTHFAIIVSDAIIDSYILDLITIFGSILSVVAIIVVFLTAILFKRWRKELRSKILLNVSCCLLLLIIMFIISDKVGNGPSCIVIGVALHYIVLVQFCWALVISYSSYHSYITIFRINTTHILLKYCVFAWVTPIIIVGTVAAINFETYDKPADNTSQICYPKGIYLKVGVCLPMSVILAINVSIYIIIIKTLIGKKVKLRTDSSSKFRNLCQINKTIILMFFTMGITWIFGILVAFTDYVVFQYLFCTLTTCYGFVLFLFYIWDSKEVRQHWKNLLKVKLKRKSTESSKDKVNTNVTEIHEASIVK